MLIIYRKLKTDNPFYIQMLIYMIKFFKIFLKCLSYMVSLKNGTILKFNLYYKKKLI